MSMWDDEAGYDRDDPKHPDWADAMADRADMQRKREKEDRHEAESRHSRGDAANVSVSSLSGEPTAGHVDELGAKARADTRLTPEKKAEIDALDYEALLKKWRFAPVGDPTFQGEAGDYWLARMIELKDADPAGAVAASKRLGW